MDVWTFLWGAFTLFVTVQTFRYIKKFREADQRERDLNFRQQRLFKEIETQKGEQANLAEQLERAQQQIRDMNRQQRDKRRIQV